MLFVPSQLHISTTPLDAVLPVCQWLVFNLRTDPSTTTTITSTTVTVATTTITTILLPLPQLQLRITLMITKAITTIRSHFEISNNNVYGDLLSFVSESYVIFMGFVRKAVALDLSKSFAWHKSLVSKLHFSGFCIPQISFVSVLSML